MVSLWTIKRRRTILEAISSTRPNLGIIHAKNERENRLIQVTLKRKESVERALRRLKKQMIREGVFKELRQRRYYLKPSVSLRQKMKAARFEAMLKQRHADA